MLEYYGKQYGGHLASLNPVALSSEQELVYEKLLKEFAKVEINGESCGELATKKLVAIRTLSVGKVAPEITGVDIFGNAFKLSDYRGKVIMLSFWGHW